MSDDLVEQAREEGRKYSEFSRRMAEDKSIRQTDNPDEWVKPENTLYWKLADEITRLRSLSGEGGDRPISDATKRMEQILGAPFVRKDASPAAAENGDLQWAVDQLSGIACPSAGVLRTEQAEALTALINHALSSKQVMDREAVARIIDPASWSDHDHYAARLRGEGVWPDDAEQVETLIRSYRNRLWAVVADSFRKADAILALASPAVVEGFVVVPKEPTDEMLAAWAGSDKFKDDWRKDCAAGWSAMIAAAPPAKGAGE